jgi:MFS family permease
MADFKRGIKAGVIAGAIYAVVALALTIVLDNPDILYSPLSSVVTGFGVLSFGGPIVRGIIFGAVFAALYNHLPGGSTILKGVVLSFFLWILTVVEVAYINVSWPLHFFTIPENGSYYGGTIDLSSVSLALINVMSALLFGVLVGFLWNRFRGKESREERKGRPALLLSFILGAIAWAVVAWPAIGFFVDSGVSFTRVFLFPWPYVALPSLFLLAGIVGWFFAFTAWRRVRRGELGFSWGLAGGILMVASGIMLLPGVLAITGGVFGQRRAAGEPAASKAVGRERGSGPSTARNATLLTVSAAMLVVVAITGFTMATPVGDYTTVAVNRYSSTAVSRFGLGLTMSLNSTEYRSGEHIVVNIGEKNLLPVTNVVRPADGWPVGGLTLSPCGTLHYPFGISILQGYYDSENVAGATPLQIFDPNSFYTCPVMMAVASYDFQPWSSIADIYTSHDVVPYSLNMTTPLTATGFWTGSRPDATFSNFTPGVYTLVGGDEWGALVVLHFTVS